jgi:glycosyltransferase involved in cell wall biosynthesis
MRIALIHDYFADPGKSGGGEKLAITLARAFDADIYTGYIDKGFKGLEGFRVKEIATKIKTNGLKTIYLMEKFKRLKLDYDFYIFSGTNCITASENHHPNILYCHTPPRYLYDLKKWFDSNTGFFGRIGLRFLRWYVYSRDQYYMRKFDKIVTNSECVRLRLMKYYGKDLYEKAITVYSFVDINKFKYSSTGDFYLSTARLDKLKRIDIIVNTFKQLPDKKLYIISSGPELDSIKKMAEGYDNIKILGWIPERKMLELLGSCIATIQIPISEDLGLGPIESMASGKPCIGSNEGGLKETIIDKKTGLLVDINANATKNLARAVEYMTPERAKSMRKNCENRAKIFSEKNFINSMKKEIGL